MLILDKFRLKDIISFETHAPSILSQNFDRVTVEGIIPASDCQRYGFDAYTTHAQIYRLVPEGAMEDNAESYSYLRLKTMTGDDLIVGLPWIDKNTIKIYKSTTATFTIEDIAQEDIEQIRLSIARHGYHCTLKIS